jgi:uncharacterized alpha/beta hydrolase family protein
VQGRRRARRGRALAKLLERHHDPEAHVFVEHQEGGFVLFIFLIELGRDLGYPDFAKWVESNGATNNDWYLYYQSSKE